MIPIFLLLQAVAPPPGPPAPPPAPWEPHTRTSDGIVSTIASAIGRDGSSRLLVKCDRGADGLVSVQFFAHQPLQTPRDDGGFAPKPVALRFDNGAANEYDWQFRSAAAYISDDAAVTSLTMQLAHAKQIKVETTSASNFRFEAVFDGPGSEAPIRTVLEKCGYAPGVGPAPVPAATKAPRP